MELSRFRVQQQFKTPCNNADRSVIARCRDLDCDCCLIVAVIVVVIAGFGFSRELVIGGLRARVHLFVLQKRSQPLSDQFGWAVGRIGNFCYFFI